MAETGRPAGTVRVGHRADTRADTVVPRTLPAPVFGFTGRDAQLDDLDGLLAAGRAG